jgi:HlyD family secretion protein
VAEPDDDTLLGDGPPQILGAGILAIGAVLGLALAAVIVLTDRYETLSMQAVLGGEAAPVSVYSTHSGTIVALFVSDRAWVEKGESLLRLTLATSGDNPEHVDIQVPISGTAAFVRPLDPMTRIHSGEVVLAIVRTPGSTDVVGYVDEKDASRIRTGLLVRLTLPNATPSVLETTISAVAPVAVDGRRRLTMEAPPVNAIQHILEHGAVTADAQVVIRRKRFIEQVIEANQIVSGWFVRR